MGSTKQIAIHLDREYIEHLKQRAIDETYQHREFVSINDLIRKALEKMYPMPAKKEKEDKQHGST